MLYYSDSLHKLVTGTRFLDP